MSEENRNSQTPSDQQEPRLGAIEMEEMMAARGQHDDEMEPVMVIDPMTMPPVAKTPAAPAEPVPAVVKAEQGISVVPILIVFALLAAAMVGAKMLGIGPFAPPPQPAASKVVVKKKAPVKPHKPAPTAKPARRRSAAPSKIRGKSRRAGEKKVVIVGRGPVMDGQAGIIRIRD